MYGKNHGFQLKSKGKILGGKDDEICDIADKDAVIMTAVYIKQRVCSLSINDL